MGIIVLLCITQIEINKVVGSEIDAQEAQHYRLFSDIDSFVNATFYEHNDSLLIKLQYTKNGDTHDSSVIVDRKILQSLDDYTRFFVFIIKDRNYRNAFVENHKIDWPLVTQNDIDRASQRASRERLTNCACCITGAGALGAYAGALGGRDVTEYTEERTCLLWGPGIESDGGCLIPVTYEVIYRTYSINPTIYLSAAALGLAVGAVYGHEVFKPPNVMNQAILHDVVACDQSGTPITEEEFQRANNGSNEALFTTIGILSGLAMAAVTAASLESQWRDMEPETRWDQRAVDIPIVLLSGAELFYIVKFFHNTGKRLDYQATIEKLKKQQ